MVGRQALTMPMPSSASVQTPIDTSPSGCRWVGLVLEEGFDACRWEDLQLGSIQPSEWIMTARKVLHDKTLLSFSIAHRTVRCIRAYTSHRARRCP